MILQYGNLTLLSVEELNGGMFPKAHPHNGVKIYGEGKWKLHHSECDIFGINIEVPDIYPILKYPEARRKARRSQGYVKVNDQTMANVPPPIPHILEPKMPHDTIDGSLDPSSKGYLPQVNEGRMRDELKLDDLDVMIEKLRKKRSKLHQPVGLHAGPTLSSIDNQVVDVDRSWNEASGEGDDVSTDGVIKPGLMKTTCIRRAPSSERCVVLPSSSMCQHAIGQHAQSH